MGFRAVVFVFLGGDGGREGASPTVSGKSSLLRQREMEETLLLALSSFMVQPKPVLVGFSLAFELRVIATLYPRLTEHFSSWVDLQELASDASGTLTPECEIR